jgi:arylsulfatase A-like enzyme
VSRWPVRTSARRRAQGFPLGTRAESSRWIADETIDFLQSSREADEPFCFIANFFDPHHGFGAPEEYRRKYDDVDIPPPMTRDGELDGKPEIFTDASTSWIGRARGYADHTYDELMEIRRAYYAMVSMVDDEVGRILTTLDEAGLADDTIVVFTSDHGEMLGDHQLLLKGPFMYEAAVHVPLIIRWPGPAEAGSRRSELVQWVDLAPTFLQAAGVAQPMAMQGESLAALMRGEGD